MEEKKQTVLTLKFIGIDDFSCPTYEDQYGRFWLKGIFLLDVGYWLPIQVVPRSRI